MFYLDKLKEQLALAAKEGSREGSIFDLHIPRSTLEHAVWQLDQAIPEIAYMERLQCVCEALGIDGDNLEALELLTTDARYRSEYSDLRVHIAEAVGEIQTDRIERERDTALDLIEAAGFVGVERDEFEGWERTAVAPTPAVERVRIDRKSRNGDSWYEFAYEGVETLRGKSGQFGELLAAVGISQEAKK